MSTNECTPQNLNPCPFCGNLDIHVTHVAAGDCNVSCKCGCTLFVPGSHKFRRDGACLGYNYGDYEKAWNTRPMEEALETEIETLGYELKEGRE